MTKRSDTTPCDRKCELRNKKDILRCIYNIKVRLNLSNQDAIELLRFITNVEKDIYYLEKAISNSIDSVFNSLENVSDIVECLAIDNSRECKTKT